MEIINKTANYKQKAINDTGEDVYTFIFSTNDIDRDEEIVITNGIDLTNYLINPVVLTSHNSHELPIGKVVRLWSEIEGERTLLLGDIIFGTDSESLEVKAKVDSGVLRAVSIGFKCLEYIYDEVKDIKIFTKTELLEVSLVSLPANPNAIIRKELKQDITIDYDKITENIKSLLVEKIGASISRNNKSKLKQVHDLIDTITMDLATAKESLLEIAGSLDEVDTPTVASLDVPKEQEIEETKETQIENTNSVDILNKEQLKTILGKL